MGYYNDLPLTNFPDSIDTFPNYLNITPSDGILIKQYMEALNIGDQVLANQILAQIPSAAQKIIRATDLNKVMQAVLAVERLYNDDIYDYILTQQADWEQIIKRFVYKNTWASGTTYEKYNMVDYVVSGQNLLYIAINDVPSGIAPTNETYWRVLTIQGAQGEPGVGLSYRQQWQNSITYQENQAVTYDGMLWMALQSNTNIQPGTNSSIWKKVLDFTVTIYPIQPTQPSAQPVGGLWFNTSNNPTQYYYLQPLTKPATSDKIVAGFEAYDAFGNKIVGTM